MPDNYMDIDVDTPAKSLGCDYDIPGFRIWRDEDGSFTIEWIFKNTRIGLNIGPKPTDHGWFVVSKEISASGPLEL